jgi:hypothetical protein
MISSFARFAVNQSPKLITKKMNKIKHGVKRPPVKACQKCFASVNDVDESCYACGSDRDWKPTHGGKRSNAGRKPRQTPRQAITVRLEPQDAQKLRQLCHTRKLSQAKWIAERINEA